MLENNAYRLQRLPVTTPPELLARLTDGITKLGLEIPASDCEKLLAYLGLLEKWNRTHNLTAVRDIDSMITRHLLDSLSICDFVGGSRLLDVGSGGGLPGIPLAIAKPHLTVTLVDSVEKKTRFQQFAAGQLKLSNVEALHVRVEQLQPPPAYDTIVARAFAATDKLLQLTAHLLADGGQVLAMTAATDHSAGDTLDCGFWVAEKKKLAVPGDNAERNIVVFKRIDSGR